MAGFAVLFLITVALDLELFRCKLPFACSAAAAKRRLPLLLFAGYGWWERAPLKSWANSVLLAPRLLLRRAFRSSLRRAPTKKRWLCGNAGQSLIEVALFVPIFTMLVCYSVDLGYFFLTGATLDAAGQHAIDYAIQGTKSPSQSAEPAASSVAALAIAALGLPNAASSTSVQVCSNSVGSPSENNVAQCQTFGANPSLSYTADVDPESPTFQLNRVDVIYTVSPPIPLPSAILPSFTFHRFVEMRAIQ